MLFSFQVLPLSGAKAQVIQFGFEFYPILISLGEDEGACGVPERSPTTACPGSSEQAGAPLPTEAAAPLSGIDADNMHSD